MNQTFSPAKYIANLVRVFRREKAESVTASELAQYHRLQPEWERLDGYKSTVDHFSAERELKQAKTAFIQTRTPENWERLKNLQTDVDEINRKNRELRNCCNHAIKAFVSGEVIPFVAPIFRRSADIAEAEANRLSLENQKTCEDLEIPTEETQAILSLRQKASNLRNQAETLERSETCQSSPAALLKEAGIQIEV